MGIIDINFRNILLDQKKKKRHSYKSTLWAQYSCILGLMKSMDLLKFIME